MNGRWLVAAGLAGLVGLTACGGDPGVLTASARQSAAAPAPTTSVEPSVPTSEPDDPTATTAPEDPPVTDPGRPDETPPPTVGDPLPIDDVLDLGDAKQPRPYDDFLVAALADIQQWWSEQFPEIYGEPFVPLSGGVFAGYPERTDPIPGCGGESETTYDEIHEYSAFYCADGDFMVYDDAPDGVLGDLAGEFGPSILGVVMAHEFGHAIQSRAHVFDDAPLTITTEQQADCFAGAWVGRAAAGEADGVSFSDAEVRSGLIAMIAVRDPLGLAQTDPGGHGLAFDRVGAFQVGFVEGLSRCAELIDDPLPLVPNVFDLGSNPQGNAPFGYEDTEIVGIIGTDLNAYWPQELTALGVATTLPTLTIEPVSSLDDATCDDPTGDAATGTVYCASTGQVLLDETLARELYGRFGDFVVGYMVGGAWSEAAQAALDSPLEGEARSLANDCLTGAWVATLIPGQDGTTPRGARVEPGDLDEAIETALVVGDDTSSADVIGSGFEKIASFRTGVFGGIDACTALIGG
ncbi:MAG: hypothetical protein ABW328_14950 [Ilumatobacteraceae bacterium]